MYCIANNLTLASIDRQCVCHRCDNPPCCNPAHLFLGTQADNVQDMDRKGRRVAVRGADAAHAKLTEIDVKNIRWLRQVGMRPVDIAAMYPVAPATVANIVAGRKWAHVA